MSALQLLQPTSEERIWRHERILAAVHSECVVCVCEGHNVLFLCVRVMLTTFYSADTAAKLNCTSTAQDMH